MSPKRFTLYKNKEEPISARLQYVIDLLNGFDDDELLNNCYRNAQQALWWFEAFLDEVEESEADLTDEHDKDK